MKTTETKTIPGVPARMIPAQPERTETVEKQVCDVCEEKAARWQCRICKRDVCNRCHRDDPMDHTDYPGPWCRHCLRLWNERYESESLVLDAKHEEEERRLWAKWKAESLAITETEEDK